MLEQFGKCVIERTYRRLDCQSVGFLLRALGDGYSSDDHVMTFRRPGDELEVLWVLEDENDNGKDASEEQSGYEHW